MGLEDLDAFSEKQQYVDRLRQRRETFRYICPSFLLDRLYPPEEIETFERRRSEALERLESLEPEIEKLLDGITASLGVAEEATDPRESDLSSVEIRLEKAGRTTEQLVEMDWEYLSADEETRIQELGEALGEAETRFEAYKQAGRAVERAREHLDAVRDTLVEYGVEEWDSDEPDVPPPTTLPRYLLLEVERDAAHDLAHAAQALESGYDHARNVQAGVRYLDALDEARSERRGLDTFLAEYNGWFIEQEADQYDDLFTDIDDAGHDLSEEQRDAVITDDKYNLVVAGAGSGKTVALTHRIAYLMRRTESVAPSKILALSYNKNASEVMRDRLARKFAITDTETKTFHSLGYHIIKEETGRDPEVINEYERKNFLKRFISEEMSQEDSHLRREFTRFLRHYHDAAAQGHEGEDPLEREGCQTLKGFEAQSLSEKRIADFLLENQIEFEYRTMQGWFEDTPGTGQYRPAFYLPETDVVLAHHPVDASGVPAEWANADTAEESRKRAAWERERLSELDGTDLVETYEFEYEAGRLVDALRARLPLAGVTFDPLSPEDLIDRAYEKSVTEYQIFHLFDSFIINAKELNLSPSDVESRLGEVSTPRREAFETCALHLFRRYQDKLRELGAIDFPDMLHRAANLAEENAEKYASRYEQVLVDEFQDISASKVRLLDLLVTPENDAHLFCVGDDWQSIYSFAGADVDYILNFEEYFGRARRTDLTANYRCPETVVEAGDALISHNERQLSKETRAMSSRDTDIRVHDLDASPGASYYWDQQVELIADLVEQALDSGTPPNEVMVLSRTNSFFSDLKDECESRNIAASKNPEEEAEPDRYVSLYSTHSAKGDEAEHVIIMHAVEHEIGFPWQVEDDELLDPVRIAPENTEGEERRLFYVALTRTTDELDIASSVGNRSRFLGEIEPHLTVPATVTALGETNTRTDVTAARVTETDPDTSLAQYGTLADWSGTRRFKLFDTDETEPLEPGGRYRIDGARIDSYEGFRSLVLDGRTTVERLDDPGSDTADDEPTDQSTDDEPTDQSTDDEPTDQSTDDEPTDPTTEIDFASGGWEKD